MSESDIAAEVVKMDAADWLLGSYGPFAHYSIRSRALVELSEGLKPVNRRVLWTMFKDGIGPDSKHMKAARVAGNVVAFHPHGSSSIEDAMGRMAQWFSLRVPLIDAFGSVGFTTGDAPAAARYWESRLTPAAIELLKEIKDGGVTLGKNFDGELDEPGILPVRWPVSIINGTEGIAVGYASKMFAHNPDEVMEAARAVLKNPNIKLERLMKILPGPDLPTGGELIGIDGVKDYFESGSGTFIVRGRYNVETLTRGKMRIIFYELPYQVSAEQVMTKINQLQASGKFKEIASVKDLTDKKHGMRLVIETKSGTNHLSIIQQLFKETKLEEKFPVNATVLIDGRPQQLGMIELLKGFIELRREVTIRKAQTRIGKIDHRLHQLAGILAVLIDIDKAISIIRKSDTVDIARKGLMKTFKIDQEQADFILSMQLRRLTKQDSLAIKKEQDDLENEKKELQLILSDEDKLKAAIDADLVKTKKVISSPRRTVISGVTLEEVKEEQKVMAAAAKESLKPTDTYITRFADGRLMRSSMPFTYEGVKKIQHSPIVDQLMVRSDEKFVVVGSDGIGRMIPVSYVAPDLISTAAKAGVNLPKGVNLVGIAKANGTGVGLAIGTAKGSVKLSKPDWKKDEFPVVSLDAGDSVLNTRWIDSDAKGTFFYFATKRSNILVFDAGVVRPSGSAAGAVAGVKLLGADDAAVAFGWIDKSENAMVLSRTKSSLKVTALSEISSKGRGSQGVALQGLEKNEFLVDAYVGTDPVVCASDIGALINMPPATTRARKGTKIPGGVDFGSRSAIVAPKAAPIAGGKGLFA